MRIASRSMHQSKNALTGSAISSPAKESWYGLVTFSLSSMPTTHKVTPITRRYRICCFWETCRSMSVQLTGMKFVSPACDM